MNIAIIGGGAAGFFAAIRAKEVHPLSQVTIYEKSPKLLSKVRISGGGRCNVTNGCTEVNDLVKAYPRGGKKLKKAFHRFNTSDTIEWFEDRDVPLLTQEDGCVFPVSQNSQSIINCFLEACKKLDIQIQTSAGIEQIKKVEDGLELTFAKNKYPITTYDNVIVATGGSPKRSGLEWLEKLGHKIENPVPSLFTFNMPSESITALMGIVVNNAIVTIQGKKLEATGPLLITHWGMSGPAILVLSAFGARILSDLNYCFNVQVNWANEKNHDQVLSALEDITLNHGKKLVTNIRPYQLQDRLWKYLLEKYKLSPERKWGELGSKSLHKMVHMLTNDVYEVNGKTTFKEEFVTCGGVSLESINLNTMESKICNNLYFAGEVMDIDGITGGYNFQAAWTTAFIAGELNS
jgi:predicted Rossmann fold flavoprotein